jgi:hypothetical protein
MANAMASTMFPSRIGLSIDYKILLLNATISEGSVSLSASTLNPALCTISHSPSVYSKDVDFNTAGGKVTFKAPEGDLVRKLIRNYPNILLKDPAGERIRVIRMSKPVSLLDLDTWAAAPRLAFPASALSEASESEEEKDVISYAKATYEKLLITMDKNKSKGGLSPFAAKQIMEFARSKGEFCPILAEEFSAGNTAVMPCGHLFASAGLDESFKKEHGKCPTCRQSGLPTYV